MAILKQHACTCFFDLFFLPIFNVLINYLPIIRFTENIISSPTEQRACTYIFINIIFVAIFVILIA